MTVYDRPFGRSLEDFQMSDVFRHWPGRTVTESDDHLFSLLTMSHHPLHLDRAMADADPVHRRGIALSVHVLALVLGMSSPDVSGSAIAALGMDGVRFPNPLFHGETLYASSVVIDSRPSKDQTDRGVVTVESNGLAQDGRLVCAVRRSLLVWTCHSEPARRYPTAIGRAALS